MRAKPSSTVKPSTTAKLMRQLGLRRTQPDVLTIQRRRAGKGFIYLRGNRRLRDVRLLRRLASLAVPPAYEAVMFADDPKAHLQAIGRDQAGRIQYRYHPEWEKIREMRKARRLARFVGTLPVIRRAIGRHLAQKEPTRAFALAAIILLVAETAIRAGSETYLKQRGTRGAATLLKSNVGLHGDRVTLCFRAKGGQTVRKDVKSRRLANTLKLLLDLPGPRLFQFRDEDGHIKRINRRDVNVFLRERSGAKISLKDFRTLMGCGLALERLAATAPAKSERQRRRQIVEVMRGVAKELSNTPTVCRKSYVHASIIAAFESGRLAKMMDKGTPSAARRERLLARVLDAVNS